MRALTVAETSQLCDVLVLAKSRARSAGDAREGFADDAAPALLALLKMEGAELWFDRRARDLGLPLPTAVTDKLRERVKRATVRNMRIDEQTARIAALLSAHALPWALIKGQARRAAAVLYPYANARTISDVDLLVPEQSARESWDLLCANGFSRMYEDSPWIVADHHLPVLCDSQGVAVELHTTTMLTVSPDEAWRRATVNGTTVSWQGTSVVVPNATELAWQALAGGVADATRGFDLRAFLSLASILASEHAVDWDVIAARVAAGEVVDFELDRVVSDDRMRRYLGIAARLADIELTIPFRPKKPARLPALLAWRSRVQSANPPRAVAERLLEEGLRVEAGMGLTKGHPLVAAWRNSRRRSTSLVARGLYATWCSVQPRAAR